MGFGVFASVGSAFLGAGAAYLVFRPAFSKIGPGTRDTLREDEQSRGIRYAFSPYQRVASVVFALQSAGSLVIILVFCLVQSAGVDIDLFHMPSVASLFADVYRIDPSATFAKTRFDNLFLPLVLFYVISLPCLAAAFIYSLPSILIDVPGNWRVLLPMAFFLFGLWLELFVPGRTMHKDLQQTIIDGHVTGYIVLFVIIPLAFGIIAAGLPGPRGRSVSA